MVHVQVVRTAVLWVQEGQSTSEDMAPVAALSDILCIAEAEHELVVSVCVLGDAETFARGTRGEAIADERRCDDME